MIDIRKIFPELNEAQIEKIIGLEEFYKEINQYVNVISRKDIDNVMEHHIIPALLIGKVAKFKNGDRVLDIGTGGGLPGIPLSIYFPDTNFILIDSIAKKINIVSKIIDRLDLKNANTIQVRSNEMKDKFDSVIGRGVSEPHEFIKLARKNLMDKNKGSVYYLSGEVEANDLKRVELSRFHPGDYFNGKYIYISD